MTPEDFLYGGRKNKGKKEDLMVIENRLASILGELSLIDQKDPKYLLLDKEFNDLLKKKRNLIS
jgi:macrolide transport system ATP-binding/permease protein